MKKEELKKLFSNESFIEKLKEVKSIEDLQKFLADNQLSLSIEDITKVMKSNAELDVSGLDEITGGLNIAWCDVAIKCFLSNIEQ